MTDRRTQWLIDNEPYVKRVIYDSGVNTNDVDDMYQHVIMKSIARGYKPGNYNERELKYFCIQFVKWLCNAHNNKQDRLHLVGTPEIFSSSDCNTNDRDFITHIHSNLFLMLSWQNRYILESYLDGKTQQEIGDSLGLTRQSISSHLDFIRREAADLLDILDKN